MKTLVKIVLGLVAVVIVGAVVFLAIGGLVAPAEVPMSDDQRANIFRSIIASTGEQCIEVTNATRLSLNERTGDSVWTAQCYQGRAYNVLLKRDGSTRVLVR